MVTGPAFASGAAPPMVTCLHDNRQRDDGVDVDTGRKHQLVDLQSALNRDGDGPTQKLGGRDRQNQAGQTTAAGQRYAISRLRLVTGLWAMV